MLQEEAERDIKDYFQFLIGASYQDLQQPIYGGWRYPVEAKLDNRTFTKFHLDVGIGDEIIKKILLLPTALLASYLACRALQSARGLPFVVFYRFCQINRQNLSYK